MPAHELDTIDLSILAVLQRNGRASNVAIAEQTHLTAPPVLRRTRTLEEAGYIKGYHARLDAKRLGFEVSAFLFVGLKRQSETDVKAFEARVGTWALVRECYSLSGQTDFLMKCVAHDMTELQGFVTNTLSATDNVDAVRTAFCVSVIKDEPTPPLSQVFAPAPPPARRPLRLPPVRR